MHARVRPHFHLSECLPPWPQTPQSVPHIERPAVRKCSPEPFPIAPSPLSRQCRGRPFTIHASNSGQPQKLNSHKGQARGRGLRATPTPPGCGVTFWNAFHFDQWPSFFIVYYFHRSIHPTVSLIHSTNGFLSLPCPFSELFEICFREVSFHQTLRRNGTDIILNGDAGQWGTFGNFSGQ